MWLVRRLSGRLLFCLFMTLAPAVLARAQAPVTTGIHEALFGGRTGAEKKESALGFVTAAISMSEAVASREILDQDKFRDGLSKIIDGTVQCLNASTWAKQ